MESKYVSPSATETKMGGPWWLVWQQDYDNAANEAANCYAGLGEGEPVHNDDLKESRAEQIVTSIERSLPREWLQMTAGQKIIAYEIARYFIDCNYGSLDPYEFAFLCIDNEKIPMSLVQDIAMMAAHIKPSTVYFRRKEWLQLKKEAWFSDDQLG